MATQTCETDAMPVTINVQLYNYGMLYNNGSWECMQVLTYIINTGLVLNLCVSFDN